MPFALPLTSSVELVFLLGFFLFGDIFRTFFKFSSMCFDQHGLFFQNTVEGLWHAPLGNH